MKVEIILTDDGSHTLYVPDLSEHYHSVHGAIQESLHVFINAGFRACNQNRLNILECGFGTGLNVLLTFLYAETRAIGVKYFACEPFPLGSNIWKQLNYGKLVEHPLAENVFNKIHESEWGRSVALGDQFDLIKIIDRIEYAVLPENTFHLIYFDAFAPIVQPELWTYQIFRKLCDIMQHGGILVTYSARGEVRRNMVKAGFEVERLPGAPGKREMLRAIKA